MKDLNFKRISKKSQYWSASDNFIFSSKRIETDLLLTLFLFSSSSELRFRKAPLLPINPLCLGLAIKENQVWPKFMFWLDSLSISLLWPVIFTHSIKMCHLGKTWEALIISMWFFLFIVFFYIFGHHSSCTPYDCSQSDRAVAKSWNSTGIGELFFWRVHPGAASSSDGGSRFGNPDGFMGTMAKENFYSALWPLPISLSSPVRISKWHFNTDGFK